MALEWNVWVSDWNTKTIKQHNVFEHYRFMEDLQRIYKKYKNDREQFMDEVKHSLMYWYWSKCEWEVVIQHWPELPDCGLKADVYEQIAMNWDRFCDYLWENKEELK